MDAAKGMYRSGQISGAQWNKLGAQKGKAQNTRMAKFEDRGGLRDQGRGHDRGHSAGSSRHIDKNQAMAGPGGVAGKPSGRGMAKSDAIVRQTGGAKGPVSGGRDSGGAANAYSQPVRRAEIDMGSQQKPDFPKGSKSSASHMKKKLSKQSYKIPAQGGQYGGGSRETQ